MTHLECNPEMMSNISHGRVTFHGWKVQMGLPPGNLLTLQESFQAAQSTNSRRVLPGGGYNRKYAIRSLNGPAPQKPALITAKRRRPTYGAKVILSLTTIRDAAGYPCSARLKALLPLWLLRRSSAWRLRPKFKTNSSRSSRYQRFGVP